MQPHADVPDRGHPHLLQRPRKLHPGRPLLPRRGAGAERLLDRRRLQLDRHRLVRRGGHGAGAMDQRRRGALRPVGGRHPPRPAVPEEPPLPEGAGDRDAGPALRRPFPLPPDGDRARRPPLAAARAPEGARRGLWRGGGLGARELVRQPGAGARIPLRLGPAELVRQPAAPSTWRCAQASAFST